MKDRERVMEEARRAVADALVSKRNVEDTICNFLLEAEARGVEWAARELATLDEMRDRAAALRAAKGQPA